MREASSCSLLGTRSYRRCSRRQRNAVAAYLNKHQLPEYAANQQKTVLPTQCSSVALNVDLNPVKVINRRYRMSTNSGSYPRTLLQGVNWKWAPPSSTPIWVRRLRDSVAWVLISRTLQVPLVCYWPAVQPANILPPTYHPKYVAAHHGPFES